MASFANSGNVRLAQLLSKLIDDGVEGLVLGIEFRRRRIDGTKFPACSS